MIDKTNWPDWLKKAEISDDAVIKIIGGVVHFMHGTWYGGEWLGGVWLGGKRTCQSNYIPIIDDAGNISIGCITKSINEWDAWFAGTEEYETKRGTESFKLIEAHYKALRAWAIHMGIADGGGQ